ncbi:MAG TPA: hypothetical protein VIK56_12170 [Rhodoferax sp.]
MWDHSFAQTFLIDAALSGENIKYYAGLVQFYTVYKLRRMNASTVRLYLLCFGFHRFRQINDNLLKAFIHLVGQFDKQAKLAANVAMLTTQVVVLQLFVHCQAPCIANLVNPQCEIHIKTPKWLRLFEGNQLIHSQDPLWSLQAHSSRAKHRPRFSGNQQTAVGARH